jgi:hypothetical protein
MVRPTSTHPNGLSVCLALPALTTGYPARAQAASDEALLARTDGIVWLPITRIACAGATGDQRFLDRYRWFMEIYEDLLHSRDDKPLDG